LKERFGERVRIESRAFPLRPGPDPSVRFRGTYREAAWQRIASMVEAEGIRWQMWQREEFPNWSLPALEAAKCAALQGEEAFEDMHLRLFRGIFEQGVNIADPDEVLILARQAPLDYERFVDDFTGGTTRRAVLDEYDDALNTYMIHAIPTVVFNGSERVIGAVPFDEYVKVLEKLGVV
jgi:predicted DsbA family dithiol-disulfide isomerase